jgi:hypothetical protein
MLTYLELRQNFGLLDLEYLKQLQNLLEHSGQIGCNGSGTIGIRDYFVIWPRGNVIPPMTKSPMRLIDRQILLEGLNKCPVIG